jgi:hypothetical protein
MYHCPFSSVSHRFRTTGVPEGPGKGRVGLWALRENIDSKDIRAHIYSPLGGLGNGMRLESCTLPIQYDTSISAIDTMVTVLLFLCK